MTSNERRMVTINGITVPDPFKVLDFWNLQDRLGLFLAPLPDLPSIYLLDQLSIWGGSSLFHSELKVSGWEFEPHLLPVLKRLFDLSPYGV